ncbi:acyl-CoA dehydrogenase family protein [Glaciimonas sp. PCH181]|uniref:acyl-CoA dehydrogenase family protein n=1 Tax=Glaciimonas sp. PCH181 TaxID=2133943 RepID=UPI000D36B7F9|nr:acyl-CoA dehydrogenase family protein [Glaciimonas sp. PCH181]PUA19541.1 acyl-CoA dehydrogenase [Glaciimonas sp. PCH181]
MDFKFSEDSLALQASTREVVNDLLKHEPHFHETNVVPQEVDATLRTMGYYGLAIPEEFGGTNVDKVSSALIQLELARMPPQFWPSIRQALGPIPQLLLLHGTPKQKDNWLPRIAAGATVCFALTEPDAGSDVAAMRTTAVKMGDRWVLNGSKTYISNAERGDVFLVFAKTDKSKGRDGVSAFLVEPQTPGFSMSKPIRTMGFMTNGVYGLTFDNCEIPAENLLGEENRGFYYAVSGLNEARINVGCQALGGSQIAFEHALQYSKDRVTFGQPLSSHQVLQHMLADMAMEQHAARMLLLEAAWSLENGADVRLKSSYAKVFCTEVANRIADKALQIFGGAGYIKGMVVERVYRELRVMRIFEGANEIQRNMIAKQLLKE